MDTKPKPKTALTCEKCGHAIPEDKILRASGAIKGARGKGKAKARTSEQARAAINARWAKVREAKERKAKRRRKPPPAE